MAIEFSICKNCGWPIFFDWKGTHHVHNTLPLGLRWHPDKRPACDKPEETTEEDSDV